jgi:hypothetical protein
MMRTQVIDGVCIFVVPEKLSLRSQLRLTGMRVARPARDAAVIGRIALLLIGPCRRGGLHARAIPLNGRLTWRIVGVTSRDQTIASRLNQLLHYLLSGFSLLLWLDGRSRRIGCRLLALVADGNVVEAVDLG